MPAISAGIGPGRDARPLSEVDSDAARRAIGSTAATVPRPLPPSKTTVRRLPFITTSLQTTRNEVDLDAFEKHDPEKAKTDTMQFEYTPRRSGRSPVTDATTFRVERLSRGAFDSASPADITHLIDRSYRYHSPRELRWHLAERLGVTPATVRLSETNAHRA